MSDLSTIFPGGGTPEHRHPLDWTPEELRRLVRAIGLNGPGDVPGTPTTIGNDIAATVGTAASGRAYADHVHGFTADPAAALTRTATAGEGAAATHARSDHVHSTAQMAWGRVGGQSFEANTASLASGASTDYSFDITTSDTRDYMVLVSMQVATTGVTTAFARWRQLIFLDGVETFQCPAIRFEGNQTSWWAEAFNWSPASDTFTFTSTVTRDNGDGSLILQASATKKRIIRVYDMGPRT